MTVKRTLEEDREVEDVAMANCFIILTSMAGSATAGAGAAVPDRIFTCKTCNKEFPSFQALGGHRASHKRTRLTAAAENLDHHHRHNSSIHGAKPSRHECSICGTEFSMGQALGGHMRRHRTDHNHMGPETAAGPVGIIAYSHTESDCTTETTSDSSRKASRGRALLVDLNLTPYENYLKFGKLDTLF